MISEKHDHRRNLSKFLEKYKEEFNKEVASTWLATLRDLIESTRLFITIKCLVWIWGCYCCLHKVAIHKSIFQIGPELVPYMNLFQVRWMTCNWYFYDRSIILLPAYMVFVSSIVVVNLSTLFPLQFAPIKISRL